MSGKYGKHNRGKSRNEIYFWIDAIDDTRRQLDDHCQNSKPDKLRFQDGRLLRNLSKRMEAAAAERHESIIDLMYGAYWEMRIFPPHYEYGKPMRLHCEELKARGQDDLESFCHSFRERLAKNLQATHNELKFRVTSLASWIEAEESFVQWFALKAVPFAWHGDPLERRRASQAIRLANLIGNPDGYHCVDERGEFRRVHPWEGSGIGTDEKGAPWSQRQWANILKDAAKIAEKQIRITPLEMWVWWCYPIFFRYEWSTREVQDAAWYKKFGGKDSLEVLEKSEQLFRRHWMSCGLRFLGRKTKRTSAPLAQFVKHASV
jgi:hypothetical protein